MAKARKDQWPVERLEMLLQFLEQGWSFAQIEAELGVTRNAIAGKAYRLRNPGKRSVRKPKPIVLEVYGPPKPPPAPLVKLTAPVVRPFLSPLPPSKTALRNMLREAVINTAKKQ